MAEYTADQIVGKSLVARERVNIYRSTSDTASPVYTVAAGNSVGTVVSYLLPTGNRMNFFWVFRDSSGREYYTIHQPGRYDIKTLQEQGALTLEQQQQELAEKNKTLQAKIFDSIKMIAILGAGAYVVANYFKSRR